MDSPISITGRRERGQHDSGPPDAGQGESGQHDGGQHDHGRRETLDRELQHIKDGVFRMGAMVEEAIDRAVEALVNQDVVLATAVNQKDREINEAQAALVRLVTATIATQAPVARDLRFLLALDHVTYELERMGDHAAGVARHARKIASAPLGSTDSIVRLGELANSLLQDVLRALVDLDQAEARRVAVRDDEIDGVYHAYFDKVLERMRGDPSWVDVGMRLLFAAHDLERIGDRSTNIAEDVVFLATGEMEDLNP